MQGEWELEERVARPDCNHYYTALWYENQLLALLLFKMFFPFFHWGWPFPQYLLLQPVPNNLPCARGNWILGNRKRFFLYKEAEIGYKHSFRPLHRMGCLALYCSNCTGNVLARGWQWSRFLIVDAFCSIVIQPLWACPIFPEYSQPYLIISLFRDEKVMYWERGQCVFRAPY